MEPTYIIARHNEDISWADNLKKVIIQKGIDLPNIGREASSYFWFILVNYQTIEGDYIFTQGKVSDHNVDFSQGNYFGIWHTCNQIGAPAHILPLDSFMEQLFFPPQEKYLFKAGAIFKVSAEEIKKRPYEFYARCFYVSMNHSDHPYCFERIFPIIFPSLFESYESPRI